MVGTKHLLDTIADLKDALNSKVPKEVGASSDLIARDAQYGYSSAIYKGSKDVIVTSHANGDDEWKITASGESLLFIEFGTGITYARDNPIEHPYNFAGSWSVEHGQYLTDSEKLAKYKGGWPLRHQVTYGNPSANVMYEASKRVEQDIPKIITNVIQRAGK